MIKLIHNLIIISLLSGLTTTAFAHDHGLSFAELSVTKDQVQAHLVFARSDLESLVEINVNQAGKISFDSGLAGFASEALTIKQKNKVSSADLVSLSIDESDAIHIKLSYFLTTNEKIIVQSPIITNLSRGHRQYLSVFNNEKELIGDAILSTGSQQLQVDFKTQSYTATFTKFLKEGIHHIWIGLDHILFLVTLLLPAVLVFIKDRWFSVAKIKDALTSTLKVVTAFTLAHSITLSLAVLNIIYIPSRLVESVIAFSVAMTALNNLYPFFTNSRWLLAFVFGLVHGFGFAGVLTDLGIPDDRLFTVLLGFNLGVEAGQIAIVSFLLPVLYVLREASFYRIMILRGGSIAALLIAVIWFFERSFDVQVSGVFS